MKDKRVEIYNVGPIKEVILDLKRVNIFMGEQSSGKSTIAKIISYCNWVEKDVALHQSFQNYFSDKNYFIERLELFHKMKGYFNEKSSIIYKSEIIELNYSSEKFEINWVNQFEYKRTKISYIPSERNIVILPEMEKIELPNNNIRSFLFDWFDARKNYTVDDKLSLLNFDLEYYYSESAKENRIINNGSYEILLSNASSGLQSLTPLIVMIDYLTSKIYSDTENSSYNSSQTMSDVSKMLLTELLIKPLEIDFDETPNGHIKMIDSINERLGASDKEAIKFAVNYSKVRQNLFKTHSTNLIIEEPEQNLFPSTQKSFIYYLLKCINSDLDHNLTLTTHSPYVLYAINNCIMASIIFDKLSEEEKAEIEFVESKINPTSIAIYEIKDGKLQYIQQKDGLIGDNFFDQKMKDVMDEFYLMLNHY